MFRNVGGRVNEFANGNAKIFNEDDFKFGVNECVVIDKFGDGKNKANSFFGDEVTGCSLAAEKVSGRSRVIAWVGLKFVVLPNDVKNIHKLAFVRVNTLNLNVENRIWVKVNGVMKKDIIGKIMFAKKFNVGKRAKKFRVVDVFVKKVKLFRVTMPNARTNGSVDEIGKFGIGAHKPAAMSNAVGLVVEHTGPVFVEVVKSGGFKNVGMNACDAVNRVRADNGKARHMNEIVFNDRHSANFIDIVRISSSDVFDVSAVNFVDNHIDTRE